MLMQVGHAVQVFAAVSNVLVLQHALQAGAQHGVGFLGKFPFYALAQRLHVGRGCARGQWLGRGSHGVGGCVHLHRFAHGLHAGTPGPYAGLHPHAAAPDGGFERGFVERQFIGAGQRAKQRRRQHTAVLFGQRLHVVVQKTQGVFMPGLQHGGGVGDAVAGHHLFERGVVAVRGRDERGALGRDQAALHGAAGFHKLGRNHDIHFARHRHQRQHRCAAVGLRMALRKQLDVINGGAGALGHTSDRGGLGNVAVVFGQVHDPVHQHAAALAAHGQDGDGDGVLVAGAELERAAR